MTSDITKLYKVCELIARRAGDTHRAPPLIGRSAPGARTTCRAGTSASISNTHARRTRRIRWWVARRICGTLHAGEVCHRRAPSFHVPGTGRSASVWGRRRSGARVNRTVSSNTLVPNLGVGVTEGQKEGERWRKTHAGLRTAWHAPAHGTHTVIGTGLSGCGGPCVRAEFCWTAEAD